MVVRQVSMPSWTSMFGGRGREQGAATNLPSRGVATNVGQATDSDLQEALERSELEAALAESRRLAARPPQAAPLPAAQHDDALEAAIAASLAESAAGHRRPASPYTSVIEGSAASPSSLAEDERLAKMLQQAEVDHAAAATRQGAVGGTASQQPVAAPSLPSTRFHATHPTSAPQWPPPSQPSPPSPAQPPSRVLSPPGTGASPVSAPTHALGQHGTGLLLPGPRNTQPVPPGWDPYADMPVHAHSSSSSTRPERQSWQDCYPDLHAPVRSHARQQQQQQQQPAWEAPDPAYTQQLSNPAFSPRDISSFTAQSPLPPSSRHTADDEALARQLQAQLDLEASHSGSQQAHSDDVPRQPPPPRQQPSASVPLCGRLPHGRSPASSGATAGGGQMCAGCGQVMGGGAWGSLLGGSRRIEALGQHWHPDCFRCGVCGEALGDGTFCLGEDGKAYHGPCHKQRYHPRCCVCQDFIPSENGRIWAMQLPFWRDKFCPAHAQDGTPKCGGCARMQPADAQWPQIQKGRHLCLDCLESVVVDTHDAQPLYSKVLQFYAGHGLQLPEKPPLLLVDSATLGDAEHCEQQSSQHGSSTQHSHGPAHGEAPGAAVFHTLGLTLLQEYQGMRIAVRPRQRLDNGRPGPFWQTIPEMVHIPTGSARCEVTAILVLFGLPWLLTGSILAHEVMHAWLRTNGFRQLPSEVEEGLCQLMALLWLESLPTEAEGTWGERLSSFCANHIRTDKSPVYGDGFRAALECFQNVGLHQLLEHVKRTGQFCL